MPGIAHGYELIIYKTNGTNRKSIKFKLVLTIVLDFKEKKLKFPMP